MTNFYQSSLVMFKPSLKRSTIDTRASFNSLKTSSIHGDQKEERSALYRQYAHTPSLMAPPSLFQNNTSQSKQPIFAPLNYEWCCYPQKALQMINNQSLGQFIARDVGCYQGLFWFFNGVEILLWQQSTNKQRKYQLPQRSEIVAFGELECSSLHFKSKNPIIMVVGCQSYIHLYGFNRETLAWDDFRVCYQIVNSGYIQKISFVKKNEIVVVGDTGQHWVFDFKDTLKIYRTNSGFLRQSLPYLPFLFPQKTKFYQTVLVSGDYICSLVREQKKVNWFSFKARQLMNALLNNNRSEQWIVEERKIEIYLIDRKSKNIVLLHGLKQEDILGKFQMDGAAKDTNQSYSKIVSINLKDNLPNILEIAVGSGMFVQIDLSKDLSPHGQPLMIPSQNAIGVTGFFIQKKINSNELKEHPRKVIASLGSNNLTLMQDSLCYMSESSIQVVKNGRFRGNLYELRSSLLQPSKWLLMTNKGYFKIRRLTPAETIIGFISERNKLDSNNMNKRWMEETNFELFVDNLSSAIGCERIIESFMEIFLLQTTQVKLNELLLSLVSNDLKGVPSQSIRNWNYQLSFQRVPNRTKEETIALTPKMKEEIWKLLINMSNKTSKSQPVNFGDSKIAGAYWQALKSLFHRLTQPIIFIEPKKMKANRKKIKNAQKLFDKLSEFFKIKKERQARLSNQLYILRKEQKQEKEDFFSYFKRKNFLEPSSKKLEESTQTQAESLVGNRKYVTESAKALENDIVDAFEKFNALVGVFAILSDVSESQNLPSFAEVFKSKEAQRRIKAKLLERLKDKQKITQFSQKLPEFQLFKDIKLREWLEQSKKYQWLDMFNLQQISFWLSSASLRKVLGVFSDRLDLQVDLLLHYWARTGSNLATTSQLLELESKRNELYSEDWKFTYNQIIQYQTNEQKFVLGELQDIISRAIREYIGSDEQSYQKMETVLNRIIELIASRGEDILCSYLQGELVKTKVTEKILYFRKLKRKVQPKQSVQQLLMHREVVRRRTPAFLSSLRPMTELTDLDG